MAQQTEPVRRAVAVKVIKAGMDSKAVLARFEAGRQALAMMDHPNIAKVLDAGTTDGGRPFFVMELVKGTPITQFCDERKLTPRQRLELFVPVCQAIQHAHQKGIIHRDLKPSNVLVALYDDRAVPKVIDFGVAKAAGESLTDKTLMTGFGAMVGTPEYMSPEQASLNNLDIDTRSDVYSLGVLLYELLTGSTPVDRKSLGKGAVLEILRIVREVEVPAPSAKLSRIETLPSVAANRGTEPAKLSKLMRGELDWVLLKALEKDRTRRYDTANGLARDIQRYLADDVVEARPPSAGYRLKKFVRRHRGQVLAASLFLFALVAGMAGTTWGLFEARQQEEEARRQEHEARRQEREAKRQEAAANQQRRIAEEKEREAKAYGLVQLVLNVDTPKVPPIIRKMTRYRQWIDPLLREVSAKSPQRFHASLALLPVDPGQVDYLFGRLLEAEPQGVLPVIRDALAPHKGRLKDRLWAVVDKPEKGKEAQRLRAAAALAKYDPDSRRWANVQAVVNDLLAAPADHLAAWKDAFRPARAQLLAPLSVVYRSSNLPAHRSTATEILADYAADRPRLLADLLMDADDKQFGVIYPKFKKQGKLGLPTLTGEIGKAPPPAVKTDWTVRFYKWVAAGRPFIGVQFFPDSRVARLSAIYLDGSAARAGLRPNDVILSVDNKKIAGPSDLIAEIQKRKVGAKVVLKIARPGQTRDVEVTLGAQPGSTDVKPGDWEAVLKSPVLDELRMPRLSLVDASNSPAPPTPKVPGQYFAAVATTEVILGDSEYILRAIADDGVRVWLDNELVIDDWLPLHVSTPRTAVVHARGRHTIKVEFYQGYGAYALDVDISHAREKLAQRQANAAVALLRMDRPEKAWPLMKHSPDPRVRSFLLHALNPLGASAGAVVKQLSRESDVTIRRALLLSLGEFGEKVKPDERKALLPTLHETYRMAADPGLHAASEWLLRQWKDEAWLKETNQAWAEERQQRLRRLERIGRELKEETGKDEARWYVNGQGQTLVAVPGPVEFWMGSGPAEEGREKAAGILRSAELRHWRRIGRSFAIASKKVTVEQFLRFRKDHLVSRQHATSDDCPVNNVSWYDAAEYCNWLSDQEGIPKDQWCYEPNQEGKYDQGMKMAANYLQRTGYRLPTEAEWEYACRAGAATRFYFGESEELLPRYAWYQKNAQNRSWPVGSLRPNDLGLFDMLGNVLDWCPDAYEQYGTGGDGKATEDTEGITEINKEKLRVSRGGSFTHQPESFVRSAGRNWDWPTNRQIYIGFRVARTLPFSSFDRYAAARLAALAAAGQGKNTLPLDDAAKAKHRRQARNWLKAELADWSKVQPPRVFLARNLWQWQQERDLSSIRDKAALAKLPAKEQKLFTRFWADVAKTAQPANGTERLEFARVAVSIAGQGKDEPPFGAAAKAKLRRQAYDWLKAALSVTADRAGKARIIAAAAPLPGLVEKLAESARNDGPFQAELARHYAERGNHPQAKAARTKACGWFEAQLAKEPENTALAGELADLLLAEPTRWTVLKPAEMKADGGATVRKLEDNSILVSGSNPAHDVYTVTFRDLPARIRHLRLEVLPHPSLPHNGPGRYPDHGGFHLTTIKAQLDPGMNKSAARSLKLARAFADFSEQGHSVDGAIDSDDRTSWAIFPETGKPHFALFELAEPVSDSVGKTLRVTFEFKAEHKQHGLGRFRLSVSPDRGTFDREVKRLAVPKLSDPWLRLAAAYAEIGDKEEALHYVGKALRRAGGRAGKAGIIAAAAPVPGLVEQLAASAANDGEFQAELARHYAHHGAKRLAKAARTKARAWFEARLAKEPANTALAAELADLLLGDDPWTVLKPVDMRSARGATLTLQSDESILASGRNVSGDLYWVTAVPPLDRIAAVRLEALPDPSLPNKGPGRHPSGNFQLRAFRLYRPTTTGNNAPRPLPVGRAWASFDYKASDADIAGTVDERLAKVWHVWGRFGEPHSAVFVLRQPAAAGRSQPLVIQLWHQDFSPGINLGRFRLSVSAQPPDLDREQKRLSVLKFTDPRLRLSATYGLIGQSDKAAEYLGKALQADPQLAGDREAQYPYQAARAALRAAAGPGPKQRLLDETAKAKLRRMALDWLNAELTAWGKFLDSRPSPNRLFLVQALSAWQKDGDLAGIRDDSFLAKLPAQEQKAFAKVWTRVAELLKKAELSFDSAERLAFAMSCYERKQFATAARQWAKALAGDPKLGDGRKEQHRYQAACAAALAAAGQGRDEPPPNDGAKAKLRGQALDWLTAELKVWDKLVASGPPRDRPFIVQTLSHWQQGSDLAGIRDAAALAKLPAGEHKALAQLWADVAALLKKAKEKPR
jgi:formylglycine-generating enzyme required for sulfatase activity